MGIYGILSQYIHDNGIWTDLYIRNRETHGEGYWWGYAYIWKKVFHNKYNYILNKPILDTCS